MKAIPLDVIYKKNMTKIMNEYSMKIGNTSMSNSGSRPSLKFQTTKTQKVQEGQMI